MLRSSRLFLTSCFLPVVASISLPLASAQQVKVEGDKPEFRTILSPEFPGAELRRFKPLNWIQFEAKLRLDMKPTPRSKTLDKMLVKWYVAVENPDRANTFLLLTKDVQHVNIHAVIVGIIRHPGPGNVLPPETAALRDADVELFQL